jgi:ribose transport system ATP-binding protein
MSRDYLSVQGLSKRYQGIYALKDVSLVFAPGEIHALLGENGAGKSTLCKILSGAITPDAGTITINEEVFESFTPFSAKVKGVGMIYQEFNLVPEMTVYENLFLGKEMRKGINLNKSEMIRKTKELYEQLGIELSPIATINSLSVAYCQLVEIGKSMLEEVKFLIMDEPTAPLTSQEVDALFRLVKELKDKGVTVIYISHRIEELLELADRITVMRDGEVIKTLKTEETNRSELIKLMVGREIGEEFNPDKKDMSNAEILLKAENLSAPMVKDISFELHKGEILGIAGLVGAGRTETVRTLFGADKKTAGTVRVKGREVNIKSPRDGIKKGVALIPEDRKRQGLHLLMSIGDNLSLIKIRDMCKALTISKSRERNLIENFKDVLSIKMSGSDALVSSLSGGNQQKVVLSKWLSTEADILLFDEPTRGIDVGAKKEIYDIMNRLREEGKGIVMISSEMSEVVGMCSRVIVMQEGVMRGELKGKEITQENILELASGGKTAATN